MSNFGLAKGVLGKMPSCLAMKVSFRVARAKIQKYIQVNLICIFFSLF